MLFQSEELQEHERWANDFTSDLSNALVQDTPPDALVQNPSTSSSNQPSQQSQGKGNESGNATWGTNILKSLDKDQSRRKRRRENAKKAKAAKAANKTSQTSKEDLDPQHTDPEDNDGTDHAPPPKKTYKQAATEEIGRAHV